MTNETKLTCADCGQEYFEECGSVIHPGVDVWCALKRIAIENAEGLPAPAATPSLPVRPRPVWAVLSEPGDDDHDPNLREIHDGDSYICELATGEQVWAVYSRAGGFELCDDEGTPLDDQRNPLDNVSRVMVRGHVAGFGPSCPKAGEAQKVGLVVVQPSLTDRVVSAVLARLPAAMQRAKQLTERAHDAPILSAERDTRVAS